MFSLHWQPNELFSSASSRQMLWHLNVIKGCVPGCVPEAQRISVFSVQPEAREQQPGFKSNPVPSLHVFPLPVFPVPLHLRKLSNKASKEPQCYHEKEKIIRQNVYAVKMIVCIREAWGWDGGSVSWWLDDPCPPGKAAAQTPLCSTLRLTFASVGH